MTMKKDEVRITHFPIADYKQKMLDTASETLSDIVQGIAAGVITFVIYQEQGQNGELMMRVRSAIDFKQAPWIASFIEEYLEILITASIPPNENPS